MNINATGLDFCDLNEALRQSRGSCTITHCLGQRFLAAGISDKTVTVSGIPGNALGAYLNGAKIEVMGNAQDAVGDTMNDGTIVIHGNVGDAVGYAMRGGHIYVRGNACYRAGTTAGNVPNRGNGTVTQVQAAQRVRYSIKPERNIP